MLGRFQHSYALYNPAHGTLGPLTGNAVTYTAADGYTGPDSFTYTVSDGIATVTGTVSITVLPPANVAPALVDDVVTTPEDAQATGPVTSNPQPY